MEESKVQRALSPSFTVSGTTIGAEPRGRRRGTRRAGRDTNATPAKVQRRCTGKGPCFHRMAWGQWTATQSHTSHRK